MVNSEVFHQIRAGKAEWLRGDIHSIEENGVLFNHRARGVPKGGIGHEMLVEGDIIIMATGYKRPSLSFLPEEVFEPPYGPPRWYLQVFPPQRKFCSYLIARSKPQPIILPIITTDHAP
jgi:hypothetical protein